MTIYNVSPSWSDDGNTLFLAIDMSVDGNVSQGGQGKNVKIAEYGPFEEVGDLRGNGMCKLSVMLIEPAAGQVKIAQPAAMPARPRPPQTPQRNGNATLPTTNRIPAKQ